MAVIHISEAEATRDLHAVLAKVRAGNHVRINTSEDVIELSRPSRNSRESIRVNYAEPRLISEILADMRSNPSSTTLDAGYGKHLEEVIEVGQNERWADWDRS